MLRKKVFGMGIWHHRLDYWRFPVFLWETDVTFIIQAEENLGEKTIYCGFYPNPELKSREENWSTGSKSIDGSRIFCGLELLSGVGSGMWRALGGLKLAASAAQRAALRCRDRKPKRFLTLLRLLPGRNAVNMDH
jgi:hypothetical protein